jgi:hypothetical protein
MDFLSKIPIFWRRLGLKNLILDKGAHRQNFRSFCSKFPVPFAHRTVCGLREPSAVPAELIWLIPMIVGQIGVKCSTLKCLYKKDLFSDKISKILFSGPPLAGASWGRAANLASMSPNQCSSPRQTEYQNCCKPSQAQDPGSDRRY